VVSKQKNNLKFLEKKGVLDYLVTLIRKVVFAEGFNAVNYINDLL
jgi:hypothetical protein